MHSLALNLFSVQCGPADIFYKLTALAGFVRDNLDIPI
jgi:hypothetical protein